MQEQTNSFGYWLRRRRKALDLTQDALAKKVFCSGFTIRKIEADERRPSRPLAERLATALSIHADERRDFLDAARAIRSTNQLQLNPAPLDADTTTLTPPRPIANESSPFVGRNNEYGLIVGLVSRLTTGTGYNVMIEGEPGIGKSRLLREITRYAHAQNLMILTSNCYEIERAMPYQAVIGLVTSALDRISDAALSTLAPLSLAELAALIPQLGERLPNLPKLSNDFPEARQARLTQAIDQLIETVRGNHPILIVVDDLQWADYASAQVLHYLARQTGKCARLFIFAYRDEAIANDEQFAQMVESLHRDTHAHHLPLARLAYADTENLVATLATTNNETRELAARLHRETDGNPFFLMSILHAISEGESQLHSHSGNAPEFLPDALRAAVRIRISNVPKPIRPILETAATLGKRFDFDTLLEVTQETEATLLEALETLVKRRLLREEPDGGIYDFSHDKLREVVYRDISGTRRKLLHQSIAETLERRDESAPHELDAQLAEHFERAQNWSKALHYLVLAAAHSQSLFAMRDALHWLDRAVALVETYPKSADAQQRLAIYEQRGAARAQAGQTQGAVADIRLVIGELRAGGQRAKTRDALIQLGMAYRRADEYKEATACLTEALAESRAMNDERHTADTLYHLGTVAWSTGQNDQAINYHQQAVETCRHNGFSDLVAVQAYHGRGEAHFAKVEPDSAIKCYKHSLELARGIGDKSYESENLMMIGHACLGTKGLGDYTQAMENFEAALGIARSADLQWHLGPTLLGLDHARACLGRYGEAWTGMQNTLHWLESLNQVRYQFIAFDCIGHLLLDLGLNEQVIKLMEQGQALGNNSGIYYWRAAIDTHLAIARSRLGKKPDTPSLKNMLEKTRGTSEHYMMVRCLDGLAEISLNDGNAKHCLVYADELLGIATANCLRELEAVARRWRGEAMLAQGKSAEALKELSLAAELAEGIGRIRLQMDTLNALARLQDEQGRHNTAKKHAARSLDIARAIKQSLASSELVARL